MRLPRRCAPRNDIKNLQAEHMHTGHADDAHDNTRNDDTQRNRQRGCLDAHIQERCRQRTGPRTGAGQGDAHEKHQRHEQTAAAGFSAELLTALFALFNAVGKEFADVFLVAAPFQHLPCEEIDNGNGSAAPWKPEKPAGIFSTFYHLYRNLHHHITKVLYLQRFFAFIPSFARFLPDRVT